MECVADVRKAFNKKRNAYLRAHPVCVRCGCNAEEVHHIHPIVYGGGNEDTNLASLCSTCHKEYDVWESTWLSSYGSCDFETVFGIFCCAPSTKAIAAFCLFLSANPALPDVRTQSMASALSSLADMEVEITTTRRNIKNAV